MSQNCSTKLIRHSHCLQLKKQVMVPSASTQITQPTRTATTPSGLHDGTWPLPFQIPSLYFFKSLTPLIYHPNFAGWSPGGKWRSTPTPYCIGFCPLMPQALPIFWISWLLSLSMRMFMVLTLHHHHKCPNEHRCPLRIQVSSVRIYPLTGASLFFFDARSWLIDAKWCV
jgi:hypothetical protein